MGSVEEIGLRSTTIRTLNNTLVYIPNSEYSSEKVENISARGAIRFGSQLRVKLDHVAQLRQYIEDLREAFRQSQDVMPDSVSVRFKEIQEDTAIIRLNLQVNTGNYEDYLRIAERSNFLALELTGQSNVSLSGPGLEVFLHQRPGKYTKY